VSTSIETSPCGAFSAAVVDSPSALLDATGSSSNRARLGSKAERSPNGLSPLRFSAVALVSTFSDIVGKDEKDLGLVCTKISCDGRLNGVNIGSRRDLRLNNLDKVVIYFLPSVEEVLQLRKHKVRYPVLTYLFLSGGSEDHFGVTSLMVELRATVHRIEKFTLIGNAGPRNRVTSKAFNNFETTSKEE
jgi:hypothetical protein